MAFTVQDFEDMLRILEQKPEWQQRMRQAILTRELLELPALFYGGDGGAKGEPHVRKQVEAWLAPLFRAGVDVDPQNDPLLADLIWWKGDCVMVVGVGLKLGVNDVRRAKARAETLRQVGVNATPVVIGEEWGTPNTEAIAQQEGVEWYVRGGLSMGFLEFRKLLDGYEEG